MRIGNCLYALSVTFLLTCSKGACSMFGANASATVDGGLMQLRALDWNVDGERSLIKCGCLNHVSCLCCCIAGQTIYCV